ncbi:MAG: molybdenum cofactor guanylyltransferase [Streptosporangiaceae bacterium]
MNRTGKLDSGPGQAGAVILAGGRGSRLGGADKPGLVVGERSLLATVVEAAGAAGARQVIVVGPARPGIEFAAGELRVVREDPPGGGPVPALRRGLAEVSAPWLFLLAADLPFLREGHLGSLRATAQAAGRGAALSDETGQPQWLLGCWPVAELREAIGGYRGGSLRGLLGPLDPVLLAAAPDRPGPPAWLDCDTPEDVRMARAWSSVPPGRGEAEVRQ